jgi:hypothetical protein
MSNKLDGMLKLNGLSQLLTEHHKLKITERTVVLTKSLKFKEKIRNRGRKKE